MVCINCPYTSIVTDEASCHHEVCRFSKSDMFLREVGLGDSCELDAEIRTQVYGDYDIHGHCVECKHFGDGWACSEPECNNCIGNGGTEDNWKWDGDENE